MVVAVADIVDAVSAAERPPILRNNPRGSQNIRFNRIEANLYNSYRY